MTAKFNQFVRLIAEPAAPKECLPLNGPRRFRGEGVRQLGRRSISLNAAPAEGRVDGRDENGPLERLEAEGGGVSWTRGSAQHRWGRWKCPQFQLPIAANDPA
jgi:hypothetical protein